jgi:hypothetical protein
MQSTNNTDTDIINLEQALDTSDSLIRVFDFRKHWDGLIRPHLHHPEVERALARGMNAYRKMRAALCKGASDWDTPWDPEAGPLDNDSSDYWLTRCDELLEEAIERGEIEFEWPEDAEDEDAMEAAMEKHSELAGQFYPKPESLDWYILHNAGHYLARWQRELGKLVFPDLEWKLLTGDVHSLAYGTDKLGNIKVIFDILSFDLGWTPTEVMEASSRRRSHPPETWGEQLTARPEDLSLFE